jgi:hypothetical protein
VHATRYSIGNAAATPVELTDPDGGKIIVRNDGASDVYIGGSNVDNAGANGFKVAAGTTLPCAVEYGPGEGPLYCIGAAVGPVNVYVLQTGEHP